MFAISITAYWMQLSDFRLHLMISEHIAKHWFPSLVDPCQLVTIFTEQSDAGRYAGPNQRMPVLSWLFTSSSETHQRYVILSTRVRSLANSPSRIKWKQLIWLFGWYMATARNNITRLGGPCTWEKEFCKNAVKWYSHFIHKPHWFSRCKHL